MKIEYIYTYVLKRGFRMSKNFDRQELHDIGLSHTFHSVVKFYVKDVSNLITVDLLNGNNLFSLDSMNFFLVLLHMS